jgi:cyclase
MIVTKSSSVLRSSSIAAVILLVVANAPAQAAAPATTDGLCTTTVNLPPPAGPTPDIARLFGKPDPQSQRPQLVKVKDDVYVIQNSEHNLSQILQFGGNITIYLTDEGVVLFDAKNEQMHDDVVAKIRTLTDKPVRYVVLTHNHPDHSGGAARMQATGATVVISRDDRRALTQAGKGGPLPQLAYSRYGNVFLGGKEVQLTEFCGHTRGDTVAYLPAARVVVAGDLVTTPDTIPPIVNYADGGTWTDLTRALDGIAAMDFDFLVGGHGPVLSKEDFLKYRERVMRIGTRARALIKEGKSQSEIAQTLLKELNWGSGPAAMVIPGMVVEFSR